MNKVLLGGSRSVSRLSESVRDRIENILSQGFEIIIGDANGADRALQAYLADRGYTSVTVYCSGDDCRNNLGNWKTILVPTGRTKLDFDHYVQKDVRMAGEADDGFFLWNGKSRGTLNTIRLLLKRERPVLVYLSPKESFVTLKNEADLEVTLGKVPLAVTTSRRRYSRKGTKPASQQSLF